MAVLVTGAAGFIGFHVAKALCEQGVDVVGVDNLNDYYDVNLKHARLAELEPFENFEFRRLDITDLAGLQQIFADHAIEKIVHLAAQAGVRYSIDNPHAYAESNLTGFLNILEVARHSSCQHLVYASSSSVYGANQSIPFAESDNVNHPVSLYAATKKANEVMAHSYSALYGIPTTGLRFFTVYGPWGRPDMSPFLFAKAIVNQEPIKVFNYGKHKRDFTYIDDIVAGVLGVLNKPAEADEQWDAQQPSPATSYIPWRIYNIGNQTPVDLMHFIGCLENEFGQEAEKIYLPMQPGDVENTYADVDRLATDVGYSPSMPIEQGVKQFADWYKGFYG